MKLQSAPLTTDISKDNKLTLFWSTWFRNLGKNMEDACKIQTYNNIKYVVNNGNLQIITSGTGETTIELPYKIGVDQIISYFFFDSNTNEWKSSFIDLEKNSVSFTISKQNEWKINTVLAIQQS